MKRRDDGKTSLVEFLRSIKFARENRIANSDSEECFTHFAHFEPLVRKKSDPSAEDLQLIRSAN